MKNFWCLKKKSGKTWMDEEWMLNFFLKTVLETKKSLMSHSPGN
jgi:Na+/H+ antiporter NhaA